MNKSVIKSLIRPVLYWDSDIFRINEIKFLLKNSFLYLWFKQKLLEVSNDKMSRYKGTHIVINCDHNKLKKTLYCDHSIKYAVKFLSLYFSGWLFSKLENEIVYWNRILNTYNNLLNMIGKWNLRTIAIFVFNKFYILK